LARFYGHKDYRIYIIKRGKTKTLYSKHTKKLAIDLNLFKDGRYITNKEKYRPLGEFWEKCLDGRWGGRFGISKILYGKKIKKIRGN